MDGWMDGETFSLEQNILFIFFLGQETQSPSFPLILYHLFSRIIDKKVEIFQLDLAKI